VNKHSAFETVKRCILYC